jgi:hypothetical protein
LAAGYDTARQPWEAYDRNDGANGSIADLLSDIEGLEEAFGPLFHGESRELMMPESTPEILQLFAPPEVHATASRRSVSLPPSLAQREHRSLAIDSPMAVWNTASFAQRESTE